MAEAPAKPKATIATVDGSGVELVLFSVTV